MTSWNPPTPIPSTTPTKSKQPKRGDGRAMYLFATIDRDGRVEFHEVLSRDFEDFQQSLQFGEYEAADWVWLRPQEKRLRQAELITKLQRIWLERRRSVM